MKTILCRNPNQSSHLYLHLHLLHNNNISHKTKPNNLQSQTSHDISQITYHAANNTQQEERIQRVKQALQQQSNWRMERTKSKQNREHLAIVEAAAAAARIVDDEST